MSSGDLVRAEDVRRIQDKVGQRARQIVANARARCAAATSEAERLQIMSGARAALEGLGAAVDREIDELPGVQPSGE